MEASCQLNGQGKSAWYPLDRRVGGPQRSSGRGGEKKKFLADPSTHGIVAVPTELWRSSNKEKECACHNYNYRWVLKIIQKFGAKHTKFERYVRLKFVMLRIKFYVERKRTECWKYCIGSEIIKKKWKICFVLVLILRAGGGRVKNQTHRKCS
jgi:hypothetical protein